jgi:hypothetical protein
MDRCLDRDSWQIVIACVRRAARDVGNCGRRPVYPNWLIVAMYLWSAWHDRCLSWACDRLHYNTLFRPRCKLPSISQFTRRIKSESCRRILQRVHDDLAARGIVTPLSYLDGKPILVSAVSKDPDAARGHISGGYGKGYKLHAYITETRRIPVWCVSPLNTDEKTVARELLLPHVPAPIDPRCAVTLADSNYDAAPLYKAFEAHGAGGSHALLAPLRCQQRVGAEGRHPVTLRKMGAQRRAVVQLWQRSPGPLRYVMEQRNNAEGVFSVLAVAMGLHGLPSFVRRIHRVRPWIGAKIILYHARLLAQESAPRRAAA